MQLLIFAIAIAALLLGRRAGEVAVEYFVPLQVCAVLGAVWAARLKASIGRSP